MRLLEDDHDRAALDRASDTAADQEINVLLPSIYEARLPPAASKITVQGTGRPGKGTVIDMIAVTTDR